jgi:F-type H+-transporting ATPase subunit delta
LPAEQAAQLQQRLGTMIGRTVTLTTKVDPALIGGMVTRIGSTVYDGSVATQLASLRQRLTQSR